MRPDLVLFTPLFAMVAIQMCLLRNRDYCGNCGCLFASAYALRMKLNSAYSRLFPKSDLKRIKPKNGDEREMKYKQKILKRKKCRDQIQKGNKKTQAMKAQSWTTGHLLTSD